MKLLPKIIDNLYSMTQPIIQIAPCNKSHGQASIKNIHLKYHLQYLFILIVTALLLLVYIPPSKAQNFSVGIGYQSSWFGSGFNINIHNSYGSYGSYYPTYSYYNPWYSFITPRIYWGPQYYPQIRMPQPSMEQYIRDNAYTVKLMQAKQAQYVAIKNAEAVKNAAAYTAPEKIEINIDKKQGQQNIPPIKIKNSDPTPKNIQVSKDGTVVMLTY